MNPERLTDQLRLHLEGQHIQLVHLGGYANSRLKPGAIGQVEEVDDWRHLHVRFRGGLRLPLIPGVDCWELVQIAACTCGLPMSLCESADCDHAPHWICDGPNDATDRMGCYESAPIGQREAGRASA